MSLEVFGTDAKTVQFGDKQIARGVVSALCSKHWWVLVSKAELCGAGKKMLMRQEQ